MLLMFDNPIFASFIPQILMVFAFLSCLVTPRNNPQENIVANTLHADYYSEIHIADSFHSDNNGSQDFIKLFCDTTKSVCSVFFKPIKLRFKETVPDLVMTGTRTIYFLRPPPYLFHS